MIINMKIPQEVETALNILNKNNFEAYIVGGCVRDSLLGVAPKDWDITTSAKPDEIIQCFRGYRTINTGLKHGTVTVLVNRRPIEITTYRIDGKYSDNRRPDTVTFTDDLSYDLKRRDFTINALAYNKNGIVDLFEGIKDIKNKIIKCVGEPDERFNEDGLRILRALRFACVLQFNIHDNTSLSIHRNKMLLTNISKERICIEFSKLIMGKNFFTIMKDYKEIIEVFIPEVKAYNKDTWEHILNSMNNADDLPLRLSLLLHNTNDSEKILKNLKYDGSTIKAVKAIVLNKDLNIIPDKINIKKQLNIVGYESYVNLLKFKNAIYKTKEKTYKQELKNIKNATTILNQIRMHNECYNLKQLEINGEDLIETGFSKGVILGSILNEILNMVIEEKLENKKSILIDYAKKYKIN